MDEIKRIDVLEFNSIASEHSFQKAFIVKDYYLTLVLYLLRNIEGIYLKGGTALNKILLDHARLSEDADFSVVRDVKEINREIVNILNESKIFKEIDYGKNMENFVRIIARYKSELGEGEIFIDLNQKAKVLLKPESYKVKHFYFPFIPEFTMHTLAKEELIAEKIRASITRNMPRDHYDIYQIIHANLPINLELTKTKCSEVGKEFSILKMFNKAKTLKNRWDKDMTPLLSEPVSFYTVIKFLASHFKLKEEKGKMKRA